jgi:hypothetical protein
MIPAGLAMKIVSCAYEGVDTVNGVLVSPSLTYFPGTQTQGADLHSTLLKLILQQDPQGFLLAGPGKVTFNGSRSLNGWILRELRDGPVEKSIYHVGGAGALQLTPHATVAISLSIFAEPSR